MVTFSFEQARECVLESVPRRSGPAVTVPLESACGRVLAAAITADRDFPALARAVRDGYAVRATDTPGRLRVVAEVRAGEILERAHDPGEAVEIMTGAPVPTGADAVVMVEHVEREGASITAPKAEPGQYINPQGSEARAGDVLIEDGARIGAAEVALLAAVGRVQVPVHPQPRVAILTTGDEIVDAGATPAAYQIRNSNAHSLEAQVRRAGGIPVVLPVAGDTLEVTRALLGQGLKADLLLISGGVSAGRYDVAKPALASLGAEFYFDGVLIRPGRPTVFGRATGTFFFGLPGNPVSTLVTFELFARAALERLGGVPDPPLPLTLAHLTTSFRHKPGLTRFLPARLSADGATVTPVPWKGSSDLAALVRANSFLVAEEDRESWAAGDLIRVMIR